MKNRQMKEQKRIVGMSSGKFWNTSLWMALPVALLVATLDVNGGNSVVRNLPDLYSANVPFTVTISVQLDSGCVWAVEDAPPAGWTVSSISDNGSFDFVNGKVKWLFFDGPVCGGSGSNVLSYTVVPPADESGTKAFTGLWSVDGSLDPVTGDNLIESDADGDGVADASDLCPDTPQGVVVDANGCSIDQWCPCDAPWKNHAEYVRCIREAVSIFLEDGVLTDGQAKSIIEDAKKSDCGRKKPKN